MDEEVKNQIMQLASATQKTLNLLAAFNSKMNTFEQKLAAVEKKVNDLKDIRSNSTEQQRLAMLEEKLDALQALQLGVAEQRHATLAGTMLNLSNEYKKIGIIKNILSSGRDQGPTSTANNKPDASKMTVDSHAAMLSDHIASTPEGCFETHEHELAHGALDIPSVFFDFAQQQQSRKRGASYVEENTTGGNKRHKCD